MAPIQGCALLHSSPNPAKKDFFKAAIKHIKTDPRQPIPYHGFNYRKHSNRNCNLPISKAPPESQAQLIHERCVESKGLSVRVVHGGPGRGTV
jgi:hypothetical protein